MQHPPVLEQDDIDRCGMGRGEQTCAYLAADGRGFICGRAEDALGAALMSMGKTRGLRVPTEDYPNCQLGSS